MPTIEIMPALVARIRLGSAMPEGFAFLGEGGFAQVFHRMEDDAAIRIEIQHGWGADKLAYQGESQVSAATWRYHRWCYWRLKVAKARNLNIDEVMYQLPHVLEVGTFIDDFDRLWVYSVMPRYTPMGEEDAVRGPTGYCRYRERIDRRAQWLAKEFKTHSFDLHGRNVMLDANQQYVITDPFTNVERNPAPDVQDWGLERQEVVKSHTADFNAMAVPVLNVWRIGEAVHDGLAMELLRKPFHIVKPRLLKITPPAKIIQGPRKVAAWKQDPVYGVRQRRAA